MSVSPKPEPEKTEPDPRAQQALALSEAYFTRLAQQGGQALPRVQ